MGKTICPITKKDFNCQNCMAIKDNEECPYMLWDRAVEYCLKFLRELVEKEKNETRKS